ncbi:hypothetical protein MMC07_007850 [Pseudocyphellaria aurata]|nr:hypothetical protein [Pseudocyphellaria aurata]
MTPRKAKLRAPQPHVRQPSDYESDLNATALLDTLPPPPLRSNAELNLSVLTRHEPLATSILFIAPYAVVYKFSPATEQWEKCGIEGTLFVCQLSSHSAGGERYSVIVLNRRGLNNFKLELLEGDRVEETEEYIILEDRDEQSNVGVYGLWIFSEPEPSSTEGTRERVATVIKDCAARAGGFTIAVGSSASGDGVGMIREVSRSSQMLSKQQHDGPIEVSPLTDYPSAPPQPQQPPIASPSRPESRDILGDLFRKAGLHVRNS